MSWSRFFAGCLIVYSLLMTCQSAPLTAQNDEALDESIEALLKGANDNLSSDLKNTQRYLVSLDAKVSLMQPAILERYVLLKASYLGLSGQQRKRIALVRKFQSDLPGADTQVKLLYELSDAYTRLGENEEALQAMNRGIRLLPKLTQNNAKVSILQGAITLLAYMDAFDDALNYADRIYRLGVSSNNPNYICLGLADKLDIQFKQGNGDSARAALNRTIQICNDSDYRFVTQILLSANAVNLIDSGEYQQGIDKAMLILQRYLQNNAQSDQVNVLEEALSRGYFHIGEYDKAQLYAEKSLAVAQVNQSKLKLKNIHLTLARINKAKGDIPGAMEHYEQYVQGVNRFEKDKYSKNLAYQRVKYDNLDKANQLESLKVKNNSLQLNQKLQARNKENLLLVISLGTVLLIFMAILLVLSFRKKHALIYDPSNEAHNGLYDSANQPHLAMFDARQKGVQFCVILFEVDCLEGFQNLLDDDTATALTNEVAMICEEQLRQSDHFGRLNEHQFVICLLESSIRGAAALAERCRQAINNIVLENATDLSLASTFGVAMIDEHLVDYQEALAAAEKALQEAKDRGGDQVFVHHLLEEYDEL